MNMLTRQISLLALLLLTRYGIALSQDEVKRPPLRVPQTADSPASFAPPGWRVEENSIKEADLNGDGQPDAALVLTHGGNGASVDAQFAKHVLVLALRGSDGKLHRSIVSDAAVLDGDEGGVFGDPFEELSIERGAVVITHYGGSRDRWGYTHRYRYQNGQWMLIGLTINSSDTLDTEHFSEFDINLSTGLVNAHEKGESDRPQGRKSRKPELHGSYYELQALPLAKPPTIDGQMTPGEWPGYTVSLNEARHVFRNKQLWGGADDLSVKLHAVRVGENLFLCAEVTDNEVTTGDAVRLVIKNGQAIKPLESKPGRTAKGYVVEARYSLKEIAKALKPADEYIMDQLESYLNPDEESGDLEGLSLKVAVEVVDVDDAATPKARSVFSTRVAGSPYNGAIRIFRKGTFVLVSDL